jgi:hypothetical protein
LAEEGLFRPFVAWCLCVRSGKMFFRG